MSYPDNIYRIAINLLLPPVSLKVPRVVDIMDIPYPTLYKWKKVAETAAKAGE